MYIRDYITQYEVSYVYCRTDCYYQGAKRTVEMDMTVTLQLWKESEELDSLLWKNYIEHGKFDLEYVAYVKSIVDGVAEVNGRDNGNIIESIEFESENYMTLFLLRWT